jgi:hypothetical protein
MLKFDPTITIGALIQTAAFLVAAFGLIFNALETRRAARQRRILQLVDLQHQFYSDEVMLDAYYLIEYGMFNYDEDFHGSDLEKKIDRLLIHFENIAGLFEAKVVTISELDTVAYNYLVIYQNTEIQKYFAWLDEWYQRRGMKEKPFATFRDVGAVVEQRRFKSLRG